MLAVRIIPCLDVADGVVVKGVRFRHHKVMGDVVEFAQRYRDAGADELVLYDITASSDQRTVQPLWLKRVTRILDIPFCVAGGIDSIEKAKAILYQGVDKISINSPAINNPQLISALASEFGRQCVVVGIDSYHEDGQYRVYQYTGRESKTVATSHDTFSWARTAERLGAGEIVLNCINQDGVRKGYDLDQLSKMRAIVDIPIVASGGAGTPEHFLQVFRQSRVSAALAASVFHQRVIEIPTLKRYLASKGVPVRLNSN